MSSLSLAFLNTTNLSQNNFDPLKLASLKTELLEKYASFEKLSLHLDMTRGKPAPAQLDLSNALLNLPTKFLTAENLDSRNYGDLTGLAELKEIFAPLYNLPAANIIAANNSSLQLMSLVLHYLFLFGDQQGNHSFTPWKKLEKIKFICPVPGYDRHFAMLEHFGVEMLPVPLLEEGPDLEQIKKLVKEDPSIKGMLMVPIFSNPTGTVYSETIIQELCAMPTAAADFKLFIDNAYGIHPLQDSFPVIPNFLRLAEQAGNPARTIVFFSTSKITFAGAGVAFLAANKITLDWFLSHYQQETIGPDKVNQLRHAQFLLSPIRVKGLMLQHQLLLAPKFTACLKILEHWLADSDLFTWTKPAGGYFIAVKSLAGTAKRVVELASQVGVALTAAGSTFPYKVDPEDTWLRLAPSYPDVPQVEQATEVVAVCLLLATIEKIEESLNN